MSTTSKILVVASESTDRDAIARSVGADRFDFLEADTPGNALAHLDEHVDLVICDLHVGSSSGVELVQKWQAQRPMTPFILVADSEETPSAIDAMKHGAADYIVKPINGDELLVRIVKWLDASRKEERLHQLESQIETHNGEGNSHAVGIDIPAGTSLEDLERAAVEKALEQHHGNRTHAAKTLGISVRTLQRKLKAWRMPMLSAQRHVASPGFSFPFAH